ARELDYLLRTIDTFAEVARVTGVGRTMDLGVVRDWLERALEGESTTGGFLAGGMTVGGLKPMRAIPFRIIAIAGLDDATFPRRDRRASYDLLGLAPRIGDRDRRTDDRQLFLDVLLSASDRVILTHVGRSATDNAERAVSVVVAELLDLVDRAFVRDGGPARDQLCVRHRLQPFSPAYYDGADARLFSYSRANASAVGAARVRRDERPFVDGPLPVAEPSPVVPLSDLVDCWVNPSRWFCDRTLGFRVRGDEEAVDDSEPMAVGSLLRYAVHDDILRRHLRGARDRDHERELAAALGILPSGALARRWFDRLDDEISDLLRRVERSDAYEPVSVEIAGPDWTLVGRIDGLVDQGRVQVRAARLRPKDRVQAWIAHLALSAEGQEPTSRVIGTNDEMMTLGLVDEPLALLDVLVRGMREALRAPVPVFELASHAYAEQSLKLDGGSSRARTPAIDKARLAFVGTGFERAACDLADPHVALCWRGRDPLADEATFADWAARLWNPLLENAARAEAEVGT
ncbi:MAG TPA: hypothetical protein VEA99_16415, partial [Gemmatimonadaceae bacterium]|nr:hypothetical protein [Gemmatimonadaceae bacterium]